jgi:Domain of unknown function (DUF4956)
MSRKNKRPSWINGRRRLPLLALLSYYAVLVGAALLLIRLVPAAHFAINAPIASGTAQVGDLITGSSSAIAAQPTELGGPMWRLALTVIAAVGALLLALPVAWIHMFTRRLRYDPSLVQSIIILPIVVAGVVLVVKNSLALAFALAGIVAGVRFRQKLNEPAEAVYVLLALGVGLAAGVQALDVALAMSLIFNVVVLILWRFDLSMVYAGGTRPMLATGDSSLIVGRSHEDRDRIRDQLHARSSEIAAHGVLIVHAENADRARHALEVCLAGMAEEWRLLEPVREDGGTWRLDVLLRLKKDEDPVKLLGEIEERWSTHIVAAEYIPHWIHKAGD